MKVLGVIFDEHFSLQDHFENLLERSKVRMGVLTRLSGQKWGMEARMLRLTGQSLVISLIEYGYVITGSGMSDSQLHQLNTRLLNTLARRIVGVGPSARLPVLFAMAGTLAPHNTYIQQCGETLNLILRAKGSSVQSKVMAQLCDLYKVPAWTPQPQSLPQPDTTHPQIGRLKHRDYDVQESWAAQTIPQKPTLPLRY